MRTHRIAPLRLVLPALALLAARPAAAQTAAELARYRDAARYSAAHRGHAVLVVRGDRIVFEDYANGWRADRPHLLASGTKTFACALGAAAVEDGLLAGWDEPASRALPEWAGDRAKARITVRQLLELSSGLPAGREVGPAARRRDAAGAFLALPLRSAPGERFRYGPSHFYAFGEMLRRRLPPGETVLGYLDRRILRPVGARVEIRADAAGTPDLAGGGRATARDWARFGRLLRDDGRFEGRAVLRADLVRDCFRPGDTNPFYGLATWLDPAPDVQRALRADRGTGDAPWHALARGPRMRGVRMAAGAGNQRLYAIPAEDLVVVRFGRGGPWDDVAFLSRLLGRAP